MQYEIYRCENPDSGLFDCILDTLKGMPEVRQGVIKELPKDAGTLRRYNLSGTYLQLMNYFAREAAEMDDDEPFVAHYLLSLITDNALVLACDVELSTPGVASRTYYGIGTIRVGPDEFIVDLEGSIRLESAVQRAGAV